MGYFIVKSLTMIIVIGILIFGILFLSDKKSNNSDKQLENERVKATKKKEGMNRLGSVPLDTIWIWRRISISYSVIKPN